MINGFFAPYAYLGVVALLLYVVISLIGGLLLGKIIKKKWTSPIIIVIFLIIFYFLDLDYSFLILGLFVVSVLYAYLFLKKTKK